MWPNPQGTADLFTFTEEILCGKLYFCALYIVNLHAKTKDNRSSIIWRETDDHRMSFQFD